MLSYADTYGEEREAWEYEDGEDDYPRDEEPDYTERDYCN